MLPITWTSFGVGQVRVETSTNDGAQWDVLAASAPAAQGSYSWTLPDMDSTTVRVRVVDAANPARTDTSDAALTLIRGPGRVFINRSPDMDPDGGFVLHNTLPSGLTSSPGKRADGTDF